MIRALHYIGTLELGGSQSFVMELYRSIDRLKVQFDFIIFEGWRGSLYNEIKSLGGRIYESPKYNGLNHFRFIAWWERFLSAHPEYKILHGHVRSVALLYLPIAKRHNLYTILHSHSVSNGSGMKGIIKTILQFPVRYQADYYMACSKDAGEWLFGNKIVDSGRYCTIPNAINVERFEYRPKVREMIRKKYGLENSFVIGHVGRFCEVKNHIFLLEILREALKINEKTKLLLVGDGPLKKEIKEKCAVMRLSNHVIFAGNRTDTEDFYQAMDVFVLPSKWEGLGIAAVEAQTCGLSCIVSKGVSKSADIGAGLIQRVALEYGADNWVKRIMNINKAVRKSRVSEARDAGFDVKDTVLKMQEFYIKAAHEAALGKL